MTERRIICFQCKTHVGTIRDAKLKKGLNYIYSPYTLRLQEKVRDLERQAEMFESLGNMFGNGFSKGKY